MNQSIKNESTQLISKKICNFWKGEEFDDKLRFPGAQPISLELKDIVTILQNEYLICPKLDGERFFLVLQPEGCWFVNRNMEFFETNIKFNKYLKTKGTILDGELLPNNFVIHDAIEVLGQNVKTKDFDKRISSIKCIMNMFRNEPNCINISLKDFWSVKSIRDMIKWMKQYKIPNDGIIFYPVKGPIGYKTQMNFFKWKPPGHHTIDFLVRQSGQHMDLITWSRSKETVFESLPIEMFTELEHFNPKECVIEFKTEMKQKKCQFIPWKVRTDKPIGNNLYTVRKTILNVKENITIENLIEEFS